MAMKAGREGLASKDVDARGRLKAGAGGGLTPEQQAKLDRALLTPVSTLTEKQIAGVGTGKEQIMLKVGNGLKISGNTSPYDLGLDAPQYSASDAGKVLKISDDGTLKWDFDQGGGGEEFDVITLWYKNVTRDGSKKTEYETEYDPASETLILSGDTPNCGIGVSFPDDTPSDIAYLGIVVYKTNGYTKLQIGTARNEATLPEIVSTGSGRFEYKTVESTETSEKTKSVSFKRDRGDILYIAANAFTGGSCKVVGLYAIPVLR